MPLFFHEKLDILLHMSTQINVRKSDGSSEPYSERKLINIVTKSFGIKFSTNCLA